MSPWTTREAPSVWVTMMAPSSLSATFAEMPTALWPSYPMSELLTSWVMMPLWPKRSLLITPLAGVVAGPAVQAGHRQVVEDDEQVLPGVPVDGDREADPVRQPALGRLDGGKRVPVGDPRGRVGDARRLEQLADLEEVVPLPGV